MSDREPLLKIRDLEIDGISDETQTRIINKIQICWALVCFHMNLKRLVSMVPGSLPSFAFNNKQDSNLPQKV